MLSVRCLSVSPVCPVCNVGVLWPNGWMDQDETRHGDRPRPRPYCVRWGPSSSPQKGHSPQFSAHVCCGQTAGSIKMPLGTEVDLGPGDIVLDGHPALTLPQNGVGVQNPTILAHVVWPSGCMDQDAIWYNGCLLYTSPSPRDS